MMDDVLPGPVLEPASRRKRRQDAPPGPGRLSWVPASVPHRRPAACAVELLDVSDVRPGSVGAQGEGKIGHVR